MTVINTNIKALYTQAALKLSERSGQSAMEQLSTGKRINSAADDSAGLIDELREVCLQQSIFHFLVNEDLSHARTPGWHRTIPSPPPRYRLSRPLGMCEAQ